MTTQKKIRAVKNNLAHWMKQRDPNFLNRSGNDPAERESIRLAGVLEKLEAQHRADMARVAAQRKGETILGQLHSQHFVRSEDYVELVNLYHLARAALAGQSCTKYDRMIWATKEFAKAHPYCSSTGAYKDLSANLEGY